MEHLRKMASRRLMYAGLQRGWEAWEEYTQGRISSQAVLKQVGSRMQIRGVAGAFTAWSRIVREERMMMINLSSNQKLTLAEIAVSKLDRQVAACMHACMCMHACACMHAWRTSKLDRQVADMYVRAYMHMHMHACR